MNKRRFFILFMVLILTMSLVGPVVGADQAQEANPPEYGSRGGTTDTTPPLAYEASPDDFAEGFEDITILPGWFMQNNSAPLGTTDWFQGNDIVFSAQAGSPTSYIAANYNNTSGVGTISNWLLTPEQPIGDGAVLTFWTRTATDSIWADRLQVRLSTEGASTDVGTGPEDVGDFTTLLLDINPTLIGNGYPQVWTEFTVTLTGVPSGTGRLAFRYYVTDGGSGSNSNYIGIDTVEYVEPQVPATISLSKTVGTDPLACATTDEISVAAGTEVNYCYEVTNTGGTTFSLHNLYDTELGDILVNFPYVLAPGASAFLTQTATIDVTTVNTATWTAFNEIVYNFDDTIAYNFEDISATGTPFSLSDDSVSGPLPLGFSFNYYGMGVTSVYASSNGFLTVLPGQSNGCCTGMPMGNPANPNGVIAGWWEDFNPGDGGNLYYQTLGSAPNRYFIVQYTNVPHYGGGNVTTLQYKLFEGSNFIEVHYAAAPSDGGTHSAGIENQAGSAGTQYYLGTSALTTPLAVRYYSDSMATASDVAIVNVLYPDIEVTPTELEAFLAPGEQVTKSLNVCNVGEAPLEWELHEEESIAGMLLNRWKPEPAAPPAGGWVQMPAAELASVKDTAVESNASVSRSPYVAPEVVLYDNGPLVTHPGGGAGGLDASALQTALSMTVYGFGAQLAAGNRVADDFEVTDPGGWILEQITFFAYQTGSSTTCTLTAVNFQIWDGPPNDPASSVIFGDTTTNRLDSCTFSNIYRVLDTGLTGSTRPIMAVVATAGITLPEGTYWIDWQLDGSLASGPWLPPVTILGSTGTGNGLQSLSGTWGPLEDVGPQDLPFLIEGEPAVPFDLLWLSETPITGTIPISDCQVIDVTFDSTGLDLGVYSGLLVIESNDPVDPEVTVPVTLTVGAAAPAMEVVPPAVELVLMPGETGEVSVDLVNTGNVHLDWTGAETATWLSIDPTSGTLPVEGVETITLSFDSAGLTGGDHLTTVTFTSGSLTVSLPVKLTILTYNFFIPFIHK